MEVQDSRRLTGPNVLWARRGAVLDVTLEEGRTAEAIGAWQEQARRILAAVGWGCEELAHRRFLGGVSLALSAPVDTLYAATEVNEWAWGAAVRSLRGEGAPGDEELAEAAERLRGEIAAEENPVLRALEAEARRRGVTFLSDDDEVSVGMGTGSRTWPVRSIPPLAEIPWPEIHDIPVALVTGTNGKTTTVRLLAAIAEAAGKVPGLSTTDGVWVGGELLDGGDYSGPGGARLALRDRRVEVALLETARGGLLRRGVVVESAAVAVVSNVAEDHLGEWGVSNLEELAETKLVVRRAARHLVANADDPRVVAAVRAGGESPPVTWFTLQPESGPMELQRRSGGAWASLEAGELVLRAEGGREVVAALEQVPFTLGGAARHNVANALAAVAAARYLGLSPQAVRQGLRRFASSPSGNPGRLNHFGLGGVSVIVDFAHNPHGMAALFDTAAVLPARRRLVLLGQAGDRDDAAIVDLARKAWEGRPDRIILKEMARYLRGREPGEVTAMLAAELARLGVPEGVVGVAASELAAVRQALEWAEPGDLLLLLSHESRDELLAWLERLRGEGWHPGQPVGEG